MNKTVGINFGSRPYFDELYVFGLYLSYSFKKREYDVFIHQSSEIHPFAKQFFERHNIKIVSHPIKTDYNIILDEPIHHATFRDQKHILFVTNQKHLNVVKKHGRKLDLIFTPIDCGVENQIISYFGNIELEKFNRSNFKDTIGVTYTPNKKLLMSLLAQARAKCIIFGDNLIPLKLIETYDAPVVLPTDISSILYLCDIFWDTSSNLNKFITLNLLSCGFPCWTTDKSFNERFNLEQYRLDISPVSIPNFLTFDQCIDEIEKI